VGAPTDPVLVLQEIARQAATDADAALARCEAILHHHPGSLPVLCLAAGIQRRAGRFEAAAALIERAARADGSAPPVLAERAALAMVRQQPGLAARYLRALLEARPEQRDAWFNLGIAEEQRGRPQAAVDAFERLLSLEPAPPPDVLARMAGLLAALGREADARARVDQALEIDPTHVDARYVLGMLLLASGDTDAALDQFRQCVARQPRFAEAWQQLLECRRIDDPNDAELAAARRLIEDSGLSDSDRERLGFAIGKALDELGQFDAAFACYREAKASKRRRLPVFDREAWRLSTDARIQAPARRSPFTAATDLTPVFIVGMPRSGTTLVDQILTGHPEADGVGELAFFDEAATAFYQGGLDEPAASQLRDDYLRRLAKTGQAVVTNKYPANFRHLSLLRWLLPEARFIHLQRGALDTCLSIYFQDFPIGNLYANDLEDIAAYYRDYRRLMAQWADDVLDLSYEALLEDQAGVSRRLVEFCGLDWDERCMDFTRNPRPVGTLSRWQVRQPLYTSSVGRWRHYRAQLTTLIAALGPLVDIQETDLGSADTAQDPDPSSASSGPSQSS